MTMKYSASMEENNDDSYKQIFYSNEDFCPDKQLIVKLNLPNQFHLFILVFFLLTSQSYALPIPQVDSPPFPAAIVQITDNSTPSTYLPDHLYKVYRRIPIIHYSNSVTVHVHDPTDSITQQQLKRERYRRTMIDKLFSLFDEDADGQLSKDELYSLSLRLNIFPKFHTFLKQTSTRK